MTQSNSVRFVVLISADAEWRTILPLFPDASFQPSPYGEWFETTLEIAGHAESVLFFHGGWGKIAAAASTQYAIDRWSPELLINLTTCGGFAGEIEVGEVILVERTVVYDIYESMGDPLAVLKHYQTEIDLSWLKHPLPQEVQRTLLVSADRDLIADEILHLKETFGAVAGDWETGAIAWVAARNKTLCLILASVSDLVSEAGGEVYGDLSLYEQRAESIMRKLVESLPEWLAQAP